MYRLKDMPNIVKFVCAYACALLLCACQADKPKPADADAFFDMSVGGVAFRAQLAVSDAEKMRGLMFRDSLGENDGMVFVYETPSRASFWMKNTKIPLDIGFFDKNGVLTEVKKLYPHNLDSVGSSRADILYCIEMKQGWFGKNGVAATDRLDMRKLEAALKARK